MADDVRVSAARAYVKTEPPDEARVSAVRAYVKRRLYSDETRTSAVRAYVKVLVPWPTGFAYRVKDGHNQSLSAADDLDPQPAHGFVRVTRREHSANGKLLDEFLYAHLEYSALGSVEEYQAVLTAWGLLAALQNEVTVSLRSQTLAWEVYNGVAVRPEIGADVRWQAFFPREVTILIKELVQTS